MQEGLQSERLEAYRGNVIELNAIPVDDQLVVQMKHAGSDVGTFIENPNVYLDGTRAEAVVDGWDKVRNNEWEFSGYTNAIDDNGVCWGLQFRSVDQ